MHVDLHQPFSSRYDHVHRFALTLLTDHTHHPHNYPVLNRNHGMDNLRTLNPKVLFKKHFEHTCDLYAAVSLVLVLTDTAEAFVSDFVGDVTLEANQNIFTALGMLVVFQTISFGRQMSSEPLHSRISGRENSTRGMSISWDCTARKVMSLFVVFPVVEYRNCSNHAFTGSTT